MADTDIIVSQMPNASQVGNSDLVMLTQPNAQAETGYSTAKTTVGAVATKVGNGIEFVTDLSRFNDKTLTGAINENKDSILALLPVDEVSGAVANFDTDVVLPLIDVKAEIKAVETGTGAKSPSNPYVISGFTGANLYQRGGNLWDEQWELGMYSTSTGAKDSASTVIRCKNPIAVKGGASYYFKNSATGVAFQIYKYDSNMNYLGYISYGSGVKNLESEVAFITFNMNAAYGTTYNNNLSINLSTDTDYHAHNPNGTVFPVSWQTEAGEVFGGYYDFTTGKLVVTHIKLTETQLRSVNWSIGGSNNNLFGALLGNEFVYPTGANEKGDILSDIYENVGYQTINTATQAYQIALRNDGTIRIKDDRYATLQDFKDDLGNLNIIVKLATPVEYDLTPQQILPILGVNNVWNDTNGDTTVDYKLGIQAYIDKKIAEVQALVL